MENNNNNYTVSQSHAPITLNKCVVTTNLPIAARAKKTEKKG